MSTLSDYKINLKFEGVADSKFTEEELTPFYNNKFKEIIEIKMLIDDEYIRELANILFRKLLYDFNSIRGGYKDLKKKVETLKHEDHESLKAIIEKELRNNMDAINIAIEAFKKEEKIEYEEKYHELFSKFLRHYNLLKRQYIKIINTDENKNYKWFVTFNTFWDLCEKSVKYNFIDTTKYVTQKAQGEYFTAMVSDDQIDEAIKNKRIETAIKVSLTMSPKESKILAIGLNKNNIFTSTDSENIINEHGDTDTDTEKQARIFKINSKATVDYIEKKYHLERNRVSDSFMWKRIYEDWDGLIIDLTHYDGDYYLPLWLRNYNYDDEHLILFNNKPVQKCVIINDKTVVVEDSTLAEPSAGAGAGEGSYDGEFKKKYLKYKYKYLNLKNKK
jgi:hypothetical protein